ncbi:glycosyltransferase family 4 protein [Nocardia fluminea]|uniref:Glycosyltransferase involved in cell wall biosynthesis n=1 Tax=Nocardia fluminea TaxID=134984 RepID=A0A2N3WWK5_9NOCA|nr:glycosyltransferase family 4 protein [Nocardia fluminea]PKV98238.1 glycosyltransferase involved in cell wall biosynthesis [Nocardia fluminea]
MTGSEWFGATPGGLNRYFTDLYRALVRQPGMTVTAAAFGTADDASAGSWGPTGGSTLHRARTALLARAELAPGTVLDRHFCLYGPLARTTTTKLPLVVHFHGPWAQESAMAGESSRAVRAKYLFERLRYRGADRFIVLSGHFRDVLERDYHVPADRISIIAPGVDLDRFRVAPLDAAAPTRTVLCVRRLERRMGIDVLLRAWPRVTAAHPDARLVVVGTGTAEAELRAEAAGLAGTVEFTGRVGDDELTDLYAAAAVSVVPTVALEGFGLIALESLAAGRAPIVTDCGGLPDAVRGLDPTLVVPAGEPDALAARLVAALDGTIPDPATCRAHARTFSWDIAAERHAALYRELR